VTLQARARSTNPLALITIRVAGSGAWAGATTEIRKLDDP
jgi:hypothetical protein